MNFTNVVKGAIIGAFSFAFIGFIYYLSWSSDSRSGMTGWEVFFMIPTCMVFGVVAGGMLGPVIAALIKELQNSGNI